MGKNSGKENMTDLNVWLTANATLMGTEMRAILVCKSIDEQDTDGTFIILIVSVMSVLMGMQTHFAQTIED